jgi:hypothetical protein
MDIRNLGWLAALAAFSTLSCGDAVSPPAEGAVAISLSNSSSSTTGACSSHTLTWKGGDVSPSTSAQGDLYVDGHNGASVSCKVKGTGTYEISGDIKYGDASFRISGTVDSASKTGTATVSLWDNTLYESISDSTCTIQLSNGSYTVESGAIWAGVKCPKLATASNPNILCAGNATIVFKSCAE